MNLAVIRKKYLTADFWINNLHKYFFYLFLLSIPLQTRIIFLTKNSYINDGFIEYNAKYLYLSDIFLIITFILFFVNNFKSFSLNFSTYYPQDIHKNSPYFYFKTLIFKFVNVSRETFFSKKSFLTVLLLWVFFFIFWSFLSIIWSSNKEISLYHNFKLLEILLLLIYLLKILINPRIILVSLYLLICAGIFQSLIAILQFFYQHSLGFKILGESIISSSIPGVAKFTIDSEKYIRAYGTFPHPNILAGFLIFTIIGTVVVLLIKNIKNKINVSRETLIGDKLLCLGFILQNIALFLTFSRLIWLIVCIFYLILINWIKKNNSLINKPITTFFTYIPRIFLIILFFIFPVIVSRFNNLNIATDSAFTDRLLYNNIALQAINDHFWTGSGIGTFVFEMSNYINTKFYYWQYQPAHNIYLLIGSEIGIIGLIIFLLFLLSLILKKQTMFHVKHSTQDKNLKNTTAEIVNYFFTINLILFLLIGFFDHYLWTIQQGILIFWILIGFLLIIKKSIQR